MPGNEFAEQFAHSWIDSWNSHDLDRIMAHYGDNLEFSSPKIPQIVGEPSGILHGKAAVRAYWTKGLEQHPTLHFELIAIFAGIKSSVLLYRNESGATSTETFEFDSEKLVVKSSANHAL